MAGFGKIKEEYKEILKRLGDPGLISNWEKFEELSKKKAQLEKIIAKAENLEEIKNIIEENRGIVKTEDDPEFISLAETELAQLLEKQRSLEKELGAAMSEGKGDSIKGPQSIIVEVRAGTGGEEAALFAADLFRMYSKFAANQGWQEKILDSKPTEMGGFKEIIFEIRGEEAWSKMRWEAGVHRVQRIPTTEKSGRVHTSTTSVAVLPKPKKTQFSVKPDEIKIDFYRASGPGGQNVNKRETAIRITHLPTGLVVTSQTERNQAQNKENAMAILEARLLERKETIELEKISGERKAQIGRAKRAEKLRTYNLPQDRITDHRIKKSWHNIEKIMNGDLGQIIQDLEKGDTEK